MEEEQKPITPHVLMFPFPAQGHINATLKLAEIFSLQRFHVTFLNTQYNHRRLSTDVHSRFGQWPGFTFREISDGLPDDHPRSGNFLVELHYSINTTTKKLFRDMLISIGSELGDPVTCIIADGANLFVVDVAEELGIPVMLFHTTSACHCWATFSIPELVEAGELPMREGADMDRVLNGIPGMEGLLRSRDLPSYLRSIDIFTPELHSYAKESLNAKRTLGIIFNTSEDMEAPVLAQIRTHCPIIYTIGPVHALVKSRNPDYSAPPSSSSLWKEDKKCIPWLDKQPKKSVIYVSFGSLAVITRDEFLEILYGLVKSSQRFLWVLRPDLLAGKDEEIPEELVEGINERGLMVDWAPQEQVLAHASVAGFLTHSGWNSTLESVFAGVPMICWPNNFDQQVNSRFVGHVWKVGLDMKDNCNREVLEKFIHELMAGKREEFEEAARKMAKLASRCVREGGSSYSNLENLMRDVRSIGLSGPFRLIEVLSI